MPVVNPETKRVHFAPTEICNLDDAKQDPGAKPYKVTLREALRLLNEGYAACEAEEDEE